MGRGKKFLSLFLAVAMTVTGINVGMPVTAQAAEKAVTIPAMPKMSAHFSFDELNGKTANGTVVVSGDDAGQTVTATASGNGATIDTTDKKAGAGALRLQSNSYMTVMGSNNDNLLNGRKKLTFGFWFKVKNANPGSTADWVFFASKNNEKNEYQKEHYIGLIIDNANKATFQRWNNSNGRAPEITGQAEAGHSHMDWHYATIVMDETSSQFYSDGNLVGSLDNQPKLTDFLTATSKLQLGRANWNNGEFYDGWIDEFSIWEDALTERQVKSQYASFVDDTVTINFVCDDNDNTVVESWQEPWPAGAEEYTYVLKDSDKSLVVNDIPHIRAGEQSLTATKENPVINVRYIEPEASGIVGEYTASCHKGIAPRNLPDEVEVAYEGSDVTFMRHVDWPIDESDYAELGEREIKATVEGKEATLKLTVKTMEEDLIVNYNFDNADNFLTDAKDITRKGTKKGNSTDKIVTVDGVVGKALSLPGGNKGTAYVELPNDLLKVNGTTARDITISMFTKRNQLQDNKWSWPMALLSSSQSSYLALIKRGDGTADFRAESNSSKGNVQAQYSKYSDNYNWNHFVIVADSTNHTLTLYRNGQKEAESSHPGWDVANLAVAAAKNELGHSPYDDEDYNGLIDEFKIYNCILDESEIKGITDDIMHNPQIETAKENLKITYASGDNEDSVTKNLVLPTKLDDLGTTVTWKSSDETVIATDGTVMRPSYGQGDKSITLTATLSIKDVKDCPLLDNTEPITFTVKVLELEGLSFEPLNKAINDAETKYNDAFLRNIWNEESMAALEDAIETAKDVAKKEGTLDVNDENIAMLAAATAAIKAATETPLELKKLSELDHTAMVGWYPLTENAQNYGGDGGDGVSNSKSLVFNKAKGVTFTGGNAMSETIRISTDKFTPSHNMTISFWAYDQGGSKSNAIGFGSGTGPGGITQHLFYVNTNDSGIKVGMNTDRWVAGKQVTTPTELNKWQHIVCVFNGKYLDLYVNGNLRLENQDMGIDLVDIWNADPNSRHFYIGNCIYADNGDADYKGSIKDVRLYSTNLAKGQIKMLGEYMDNLPREYATNDLLADMGSRLVSGKNRVNITTKDIHLTETLKNDGYEASSVTWELVSADDGLEIDLAEKKATLPDTPKLATVKATVVLKDQGSFDVEFEFQVAKPSDANTRQLRALLDEIADANLNEEDYIPAAWKTFNEAYENAVNIVGYAPNQATVDKAKEDLETAFENLKNAKRADKTELIETIQQATILMDSMELPYPPEAREALQLAINRARAVRSNTSATAATVEKAVADLKQAMVDFDESVPANRRPASDADMNNLAKKIDDAKKAIDRSKYTAEAIAELQEAIDAASELAEADNLTRQNVLDAINDLDTAINTLKASANAATPNEKKELTDAIDDAKKVDTTKYTPVSVKAYEDALASFEAIANKTNVTKGEIDKALADLDAAKEALETSGKPATEADRGNLSITILRASREDMSDYPQSAVNAYTAKLNELRTVALKNGLTKGEIDQALADLDAATAALEATKGHKDPADMTALNKSIADAEKLNEKDYTAASWAPFKAALDAANAVAAKTDATQTEVDDAKKALDEASGKLAKVPGTTVTNKTKSLVVGETYKITKSGYSYKTANKSIATVSSKGVVTAKKDGKVVVTATSNDKKAEIRYTITVKKAPSKIAKVTYKNGKKTVTIKLKKNKGTVTLKKGKSITLKPALPSKTYSKFKYTLSGKNAKKIASVSAKGVVKAKKKGTVTVKIQTLNKKSVTITVKIK